MTFSQRAVEAAAEALSRTFCDHWFGPNGLATKHKMTRDFVNGAYEWKAEAQAALTAALAVDGVALQGWQPIESAPKDGTKILATGGGLRDDIETISYNKEVGCWLTPTCTLDDHDNDPNGYSRPAFWMPKPPLPLSAAASDGEERK